ncbi:MAG: OmpA family protein [Bacteroidia bacterium]|nr:OmpA family protein [Bacteroidia bacterium]
MKRNVVLTLILPVILVILAGNNLTAQKTIVLKSYFEKYVSADAKRDGQLVADRKNAKEWEQFVMKDLPGGKVALKAYSGKYVSVDDKKDGALIARSVMVGDPESFTVIKVNDDWVALKAFNGKFVSADNNKGGLLLANRTSVAEWESFSVIVIKDESTPVEKKTVSISGKVLNSKTRQPIKADITFEEVVSGNIVASVTSDPVTGSYQASLPAGEKIAFYAKAKDYVSVNEMVNTDASKGPITKDLSLVSIAVGETVKLNNIFFQTGKSTLKADSYAELDRVVQLFKDYPTLEIEVSGHTDNVGSDEVNNKLSQDRAQAVKDYLVSQGIQAQKIQAKGYGKSKPVAANDSEEGKAKNRRVDFTILKK